MSIAEFAQTAADVMGYRGKITYDASSTPRKLVDVSQLSALGWKARISLKEGLGKAYADFLTNPMRER
jgi:GDP-L-fucose synthase